MLTQILFLLISLSSCKHFVFHRRSYNLDGLAKPNNGSYSQLVGNITIYWNFNTAVPADSIECDSTAEDIIAWEKNGTSCTPIAEVDHSTVDGYKNDQGLVFNYSHNPHGQGIFVIELICSSKNHPEVNRVDPITYKVSWLNPKGCPLPRRLSVGSIGLIAMGGLLFCYLVGGMIYNFCFAGKKGRRICPHFPFWAELPSLIMDAFRFMFGCCCRSQSEVTYATIE